MTAPVRALRIPATVYLEVLERYLELQSVRRVSEAMYRSHMWVYHRLQELGVNFRPRGQLHIPCSVGDCNHPDMLRELLDQLRSEALAAGSRAETA